MEGMLTMDRVLYKQKKDMDSKEMASHISKAPYGGQA
jgi:hypothetical protein